MTQLLALLISLGIEAPIVLLILFHTGYISCRWDIFTSLIIACAATLLTHPFAWESNQVLIPFIGFSIRVILIESIVSVTEGIVYRFFLKISWQKSLLTSLVANGSSFIGGLLIDNWFGYR